MVASKVVPKRNTTRLQDMKKVLGYQGSETIILVICRLVVWVWPAYLRKGSLGQNTLLTRNDEHH